MHESGIVYNNLKIHHILIGDGYFAQGSRDKITLVDFSRATEILDKDGVIIKNDGSIYKDPTEMLKSF